MGTEGNIMTYLGLIEQRANEMLTINNQVLKAREGEDVRGSVAPGPQSAAGATHILNIHPPTTGDEYDEEEESEDEDETRAQKQMTKKEASSKKKGRKSTKK